MAGGNDTYGDEAILSGIWNAWSGALGHFHYTTDGPRTNSDQQRDVYTAFLQWTPSSQLSLQGEFRRTEFDRGDVLMRFGRDNFFAFDRFEDRANMYRVGGRLTLAPGSDLIASVIHQQAFARAIISGVFDIRRDDDGTMGELQYLYRRPGVSVITGLGYFWRRGAARSSTPASS